MCKIRYNAFHLFHELHTFGIASGDSFSIEVEGRLGRRRSFSSLGHSSIQWR